MDICITEWLRCTPETQHRKSTILQYKIKILLKTHLSTLSHGSSSRAHSGDWRQGRWTENEPPKQELELPWQRGAGPRWGGEWGRGRGAVGLRGNPLNHAGPVESWGQSRSWEDPFRCLWPVGVTARGKGERTGTLLLHPGSAEGWGPGKAPEKNSLVNQISSPAQEKVLTLPTKRPKPMRNWI